MKHEINRMCEMVHAENTRWWHDLVTGEDLSKNSLFFPSKVMMVVTELSEAIEADRKKMMDDKLPHRFGVEVELADAVIRIFDLAGGYGMDLGGAIEEKLQYNRTRIDHTPEHRSAEGGKSY